jgi:hypothetical protein
MLPNESSDVGVLWLGDLYERALRRLGVVIGVLAFATIPVLTALFTEGRGTPAVLAAWRIGFVAMWTLAFIGMVRCVLSVLRLRTRIERPAAQVRLGRVRIRL